MNLSAITFSFPVHEQEREQLTIHIVLATDISFTLFATPTMEGNLGSTETLIRVGHCM
jgi:hypothetical protein